METSSVSIFLMLLALILGAPASQDASPQVDLRQYVPQEAPLHASLDLSGLREHASFGERLIEKWSGCESPEEAREKAVGQIADCLKIPRETVEKLVFGENRVRRIGFWILGFGERECQFRPLLLLERTGGGEILPDLLACLSDSPDYHSMKYAGSTIHALFKNRSESLWFAETGGKIAVAVDSLAIQSFLLRCRELEGASLPAAPQDPAFLRAEVRGPAMLNAFVNLVDSPRDRQEFFSAASLLGFAEMRSLSLGYDGATLKAELAFHEAGELLPALQAPAEYPKFLRYIPEKTELAWICSLSEPMNLLNYIHSRLQPPMFDRHRHSKEALFREFRQDTGLDLEADVFANVKAFAYLVPKIERERDLERKFLLLLEVEDADQARDGIERMVAKTSRGRGGVCEKFQDASVWKTRDAQFALIGHTVVLMPPWRPIGEILEARSASNPWIEELSAAHSPCSSILWFRPETVAPELGSGKFSCFLRSDGNRLNLEAEIDMEKICAMLPSNFR